MSGDKSDVGSNVRVIGLLGMALSLILIGLTLLPKPYSNGFAGFGPAIPVAGLFGGLILIIVGLLAAYKGNVFWGSAFASYGAFFAVWTSLWTGAGLAGIIGGGGGATGYGLAGVSAVFALMTLTFLISSMKHGWMAFLLYLFFGITTILWTVLYWMLAAGNSVSTGQMWANGIITILTGIIAWWMATTHLTNWTYGRKVLPG